MPGGDGVVIDRVGISTNRVEEAVDLAQGVMKTSGTRPAVAASEDRLVSILGSDTIQLGCNQVQCLFPLHLDEGLPPPPLRVGSGAVPVPRLPNRRALHPAPANRLQRLPDGRGIGILGERMHGGDVATVGLYFVGTPIGQGPVAGIGHFTPIGEASNGRESQRDACSSPSCAR